MFIETADKTQWLNIDHIESMTIHQGNNTYYVACKTTSGSKAVLAKDFPAVEDANAWVEQTFEVASDAAGPSTPAPPMVS